MKLMITWKLHEGKLHEALALFTQMTPEDEQKAMGSSIKLLGRWHDLVRGRGFALFESDRGDAIAASSLRWNGLMDLEVNLVVDDAEARALGRGLNNERIEVKHGTKG